MVNIATSRASLGLVPKPETKQANTPPSQEVSFSLPPDPVFLQGLENEGLLLAHFPHVTLLSL